MALQDIVTAITAHADREVAALRSAHERVVHALHAQHQDALNTLRSSLSERMEARKAQLISKTKAHAMIDRRNRIASAKQDLITVVFAETLGMLSTLPDGDIKPLLQACLQRIKGKGMLHPSKRHEALLRTLASSEQFTIGTSSDAAGGFLFVGTRSEADFTLEHIVHGLLRPRSELDIGRLLFEHSA